MRCLVVDGHALGQPPDSVSGSGCKELFDKDGGGYLVEQTCV